MADDYRERCFEAKGESCELCEGKQNVVVHHIDGDRTNGNIDNLMPVCRACHSSIHGGGQGELSDQLPPESRSDMFEGRGMGMRPNIQITHETHGRIKQLAARWGVSLDDMYCVIIEAGLEIKGDET